MKQYGNTDPPRRSKLQSILNESQKTSCWVVANKSEYWSALDTSSKRRLPKQFTTPNRSKHSQKKGGSWKQLTALICSKTLSQKAAPSKRFGSEPNVVKLAQEDSHIYEPFESAHGCGPSSSRDNWAKMCHLHGEKSAKCMKIYMNTKA